MLRSCFHYFFLLLVLLQLYRCLSSNNIAKKVGNYWICDMNTYPHNNCEIKYSYDTRVYFTCPRVKKVRHINCIVNKNLNNNSNEIIFNYASLPNIYIPGVIIRKTHNFNKVNVYINAPFRVPEDTQMVCACDNTQKDRQGLVKINIKKTSNALTKGCDYGNNTGSKKFLTNSIDPSHAAICNITAGPGEVIGVNCVNFERMLTYDIYLQPPNAFYMVRARLKDDKFVEVPVQSVLPGAKSYPEYISPFIEDGFYMYSTTAYLKLPNEIEKSVVLSVTCQTSDDSYVANYSITRTKT